LRLFFRLTFLVLGNLLNDYDKLLGPDPVVLAPQGQRPPEVAGSRLKADAVPHDINHAKAFWDKNSAVIGVEEVRNVVDECLHKLGIGGYTLRGIAAEQERVIGDFGRSDLSVTTGSSLLLCLLLLLLVLVHDDQLVDSLFVREVL